MIPVLIVDDEFLLRQLIRNSLDWGHYGFTIVGEAENGEEALEKIVRLQPSLVLLDINLPLLNGLELAFLVKERHPSVRVLILTGYDDITYVKQALRAGVADYLLKPLDPKVLIQALGEIKKRFEAPAANPAALFPPLENIFSTVVPPGYLVGVAEAALADASPTLPLLADRLALGLNAEPPLQFFTEGGNRLFFLAQANPQEADWRLRGVRYGSDLALRFLKEKGLPPPTIGLSTVKTAGTELPQALEEARKALDSRFHQGPGQVFLYQEATNATAGSQRNSFDRAAFQLLLRSSDLGRAKQVVEAYFEDAKRNQYPAHQVRMQAIEIASAVLEHQRESSEEGKEDDVLGHLLEKETRQELHQFVLELTIRSLGTSDRGTSRSRKIVQRAQAFIDASFSNSSINLESIAVKIEVSPGYLSSVFKALTGLSVIEALTETRLIHAKKLLDENPLIRIHEVAEQAGYSDAFYFSKAFKKRFGISPTRYHERG